MRSEGQLTPTQDASKTRPSSKAPELPTSQGYPKCLLRGNGECPARTGWFSRGLRRSVLSHAHQLPPLGPLPQLLQWLRKTSPMGAGLKSRHCSWEGWCQAAGGSVAWSIILYTRRWRVRWLIRAHTQVSIPNWGACERQLIDASLSLPSSLRSIKEIGGKKLGAAPQMTQYSSPKIQ